MGRKNHNETNKVQPTLSAQQCDYLKQLVAIGNYGNTPTAVALHLIQFGITHYMNLGMIRRKTQKSKRA